MNLAVKAAQQALQAAGHDPGAIDGDWGKRTRTALQAALAGDPRRIGPADLADAAKVLPGCSAAHVGAFADVESGGAGFDPVTRRPVILFEPHVFNRLTEGRFAASHPHLAYASWGDRPYPNGQAARYEQLLEACSLHPAAALSAASWGLFQILGVNFGACGFDDVFEFAFAQAKSEGHQLAAVCRFLNERGITRFLAAGDWAQVARRYNGPRYADHSYDLKLGRAYARRLLGR
jgi:hypothetical protein